MLFNEYKVFIGDDLEENCPTFPFITAYLCPKRQGYGRHFCNGWPAARTLGGGGDIGQAHQKQCPDTPFPLHHRQVRRRQAGI